MMTLAGTCRTVAGLALRMVRKLIPIVLVGLVLILSLFAGAIISSIFLHAVEF